MTTVKPDGLFNDGILIIHDNDFIATNGTGFQV